MKQGTNTKVGYHPEQCDKSTQHWYTCKLNQKDGETGDVKRITRFVTKKPGWIGQSGIFPGDCEYFAQISVFKIRLSVLRISFSVLKSSFCVFDCRLEDIYKHA